MYSNVKTVDFVEKGEQRQTGDTNDITSESLTAEISQQKVQEH